VLTDEDKLDELIRVDFDLEVEQYFEDKKINRDTVVQREHVTDLNEKLKVCLVFVTVYSPLCFRLQRHRQRLTYIVVSLPTSCAEIER